MKRLVAAGLAALSVAGIASAHFDARPGETEIEFAPGSGEPVLAYRGSFEVPENRSDPDSRMIEIGYVRFPATTETPGSPIVYLSGGPGGSGSGTARGPRFPLFMAMRQHGDVYAYDQRGTGLSENGLTTCTSDIRIDETRLMSEDEWGALQREAAVQCEAEISARGYDLGGYTTAESAADIRALRDHIGAEQVSLWGISYGSHLAFALLDAAPEGIDRVVIASAEGLDQTVKLPVHTAGYFERLQAAVNTQPEVAARYPDITGLMARVHERLAEETIMLDVPVRGGDPVPMRLQPRHMQWMASGVIRDPEWAAVLLELYGQADRGEFQLIAQLMGQFYRPGEPISFSPMSLAMDRASGISVERLAEFEAQVGQSLIGGWLNAPMPHLLPVLTDLDLGPDFRDGPFGDTPVLLLTGTLDGRTYPEEQVQAVEGLSNVTQVTIVNAGHNLFMSSPEVGEVIHQFMRGEPVDTTEIVIDLPDFTIMPFGG